ncbi:transglutaminase family protein [Rhodoferax sp. UBA5149]|uniref:transglutaminase family protein n=1 Tax=Rhodoferax sp. UBA5149 TaxID=1947379 RepID=UPI0032E398D1
MTHETRYDYLPAVETAQHIAYLQPLNTRHQQLLSYSLDISPTPAHIRQTLDVFGNARCYFSLQTPHTTLTVVARSVVATVARALPASSISWEQTQTLFRYQSGGRFDAATEFVFASPFCPHSPEFAAYAQPSFAPGVSVLAAATDLMQRIHTDLMYESDSTQVNTPAVEALAQRKGVCQDFAHILIACLRAMGIPARYVSGYLLTEAAPGTVKLTGSDASHAWAAVYVPDLPPDERWCDLDPTNNRSGWHSPGEDYVTLAIGRDFSDVSPIRGVIHGGASHTLSVAVTVEPVPGDNQANLFIKEAP